MHHEGLPTQSSCEPQPFYPCGRYTIPEADIAAVDHVLGSSIPHLVANVAGLSARPGS